MFVWHIFIYSVNTFLFVYWQTRPLLDEELADNLSFDVEYGQGHSQNIIIKDRKTWVKRPNFDPPISPALMSVLSNTLTSSDQLLELEPESKCMSHFYILFNLVFKMWVMLGCYMSPCA